MTDSFQNTPVVSNDCLFYNFTGAVTEASLLQGQEVSQQILDNSDDCIKLLDLSGQLLFMNSGGQALLGIRDFTPLMNTAWVDFWQGEDRQSVEKAIAIARSGGVCSFQGYCPTQDGTPKWWDVKVSPIRNTAGQVERLLCISRDITQRKQIELERQQAEERLSAIFSRAAVGLSEISLDGKFQQVNDELCRILGRSRSEILAVGVIDVTYPEDIAKSLEQLQHLVATGEKISLDKRYVHPDGTIAWANSSLTRLDDEQGLPRAVLAVTVDISDRVRVEEERQQAEAIIRRAAELNAFRVSLADALRPLANPVEIQETASRILGQYLGLNRVVYFEVQDDDYLVERDYVNGVRSIAGRYPMCSFGEELLVEFRQGHSIASSDVASDSTLSAAQRSIYAAVQNAAHIGIPLIKDGEFVAGLAIHNATPRTWTSDEIALVEEVAERTWAAVERARAEANLRKSEEKYRTLFESIDEGFAVCELIFDAHGKPCDYRFLQVNPAFAQLTGLSEAEGKTARELVPNIDEDPWIEIYGNVVSSRESVRVEQQSIALNRWFDVNAFCVDDLQPHRFGLLFSEISDRKRIEAALRDSEVQTRNILDSISDGFFALDDQWRFTYVNQAAELLTGRLVSEILGSSFWDEFPSVIGTEFEVLHLRAMHDRVSGSVTAFYPDHDRWYEVSSYPAENGIIIYFRNVSDLKRAEVERERLLQREQAARQEAERANRIKDEFLAVLSHELRTPLNPILGWTRMLQTGRLDAVRSQEALNTIERNAKLQAQLVEDLLDLSRILRGKLALNISHLNLVLPIRSAIETVRFAAEAKQLQIHTILDPNVPSISGDASRLQQVVWNLLSNSVKFTDAGGRIEVRLTQVGSMAQITVSDTGRGISPEFLPHVFEHFRQEDGSTTRQFGGLGLGLAIVRQITELHGGNVRAESLGENQGATFTVELPIVQQKCSESIEMSQSPVTDIHLDNIHILLVDDDTDTRHLQTFVLEQSGAKVTAVASGIEVLQALDQVKPHILVSDIGMPEMDGYQLMEQIRSRFAEQGGTIHAIALTAYAGELDQQRARQAGFQAYLTKPVEPETLVNAIVHLLEPH
ncbi:PAS domain S-box protein [Leptolyngbya sp. NIES-2104]|uniref:PAS domain S-box protein n=1 Tax=Leptolyngbya sp. NIES-2104 TaxID=1552121 RepID=UPI0006EC565D|nr:PAS domain S-box protein [Leptolyngbya sp. NIES-2104]GAP98769.1 two-component hybrid sensor and regulator [Leptolyngbya sp. NIES-2104]